MLQSMSFQRTTSAKELRSLWCVWSPVLCCRITTSPGQKILDKSPTSILMALTSPHRRPNMATQLQVFTPPPRKSGIGTTWSTATSGLLAAMTPWNPKQCLRPRVTQLNVTKSRFSFKCGILCKCVVLSLCVLSAMETCALCDVISLCDCNNNSQHVHLVVFVIILCFSLSLLCCLTLEKCADCFK